MSAGCDIASIMYEIIRAKDHSADGDRADGHHGPGSVFSSRTARIQQGDLLPRVNLRSAGL